MDNLNLLVVIGETDIGLVLCKEQLSWGKGFRKISEEYQYLVYLQTCKEKQIIQKATLLPGSWMPIFEPFEESIPNNGERVVLEITDKNNSDFEILWVTSKDYFNMVQKMAEMPLYKFIHEPSTKQRWIGRSFEKIRSNLQADLLARFQIKSEIMQGLLVLYKKEGNNWRRITQEQTYDLLFGTQT